MLSITIIAVGKMKETFFKQAINEYSKRLSRYCHLNIIEIPDEKLPSKLNSTIIGEIKEKEGNKIITAMKKSTYTIALDLSGKQYSSEAFSNHLDNIALNFNSSITFIIGGTLGLSNSVLALCDEKLCFSSMTFPHQLIRIFLLEQLFRAFKISKGEIYHW